MTAPAIGVRPRFAPRHAAIDWSHPLAQGLVFCVAGDEAVDIVSGNRGSQQTSPSLGSTMFGGALATAATSTGTWHFPCTAAVQTMGAQFSVAWFGTITAEGADSALLCVPTTATWTNPFANVSLRRSASSTSLAVGFAGFEAANKSAEFVSGWSLGRHCYVAVRDGATVTAYDNALQIGTEGGNSTAANSWATPQPVALLGRWSISHLDGVGAAVSFAALWNRPLSASDAAALQADPFCMLRS